MKKMIFTLLGLLMITSASADEYQYSPLVKEGKKWVEYYENTMDFTSGIIYYQFKGETEINGVTYHNLYATLNSDKIANETTPIAYVREQDRKVFAIVNESNVVDFPQGYYPLEIDRCQYDASSNEFFIYDFNDITSPYDASGFAGDVNISQTDVNGQMVNIYSVPSNEIIYFDDEGMDKHEFVVQEAVGTLHEVFINPWPFYPTNGLHFNLAWVEDNGQYLYKGAFYDKAIQLVEQEYVPLVREGVKWVEYYNNSIENTQAVTTYQFSGNIEIGGNIYSKLYACPKVSNVTQDEIPVAYVRERDKVVYCIPVDAMIYGCILSNEDIGEYMIYNFNDITSPYTVEEELISPITTEQMLLGDKLVNLYNLGGTKRIAEGIGCLENVFFDPWPMVMPDGSHTSLAWFEDNGEILFKGEDYDAAMEYLSNQTTFLPVLSEGKSWEVATISWDDENFPNGSDTTGYYTVSVVGDTIVNNLTCKKIAIVAKDNSKSSNSAVAYEKNGKVWNVREDGELELIFDIGLHQSDYINPGYVLEEDYISVNGVNRKRLMMDSGVDCDDYFYYVVEGIGINTDKWVFNFGVGNENEYAVMLSCKENGETVFTDKDFKMENEYVPLVREGVVWEYVGFRQDDDENPIYTLYTLEFNGTTEIDGLLYHNVYRTDYNEQGNAQEPYLVTYVREENKVVTSFMFNEADYYENYWWCIPKTLYDFNKEMFLPDWSYEDLPEMCWPTDYMNPQSVSSFDVEVGGTTRKGYYIDNGIEYYSFKTIEGIGVDCNFGDLLVPYRNYYTGFNPMAGLAAVYENVELVYKGCKYNRAQSLKKDVDGDGAVTAADVTAIYDFMLNSSDEYNYNEMCDVDGDNQVTAADITAIYNVILGEQ